MLHYKNLLPSGVAGPKLKNETEPTQAPGSPLKAESIKDGQENEYRGLRPKKKKSGRKKSPRKYVAPIDAQEEVLGELEFLPSKTFMMEAMGKDSMIRNILEETIQLHGKKKKTSDRRFPLTHQSSLPESPTTKGRGQGSFSMGLSSLSFAPLKMRRVFGRTDTIGVLNLTGIHRSHIVYAASNVVVIFDYYMNRQSMLQGHKHKITALAKDKSCRFFASADVGEFSNIIIWDLNSGFPHKTYSASHSGLGVISIGFIGEEEHIGTIGVEQKVEESAEGDQVIDMLQTVCIWNFSHHDDPNHPGHLHHERAGGHPEAFMIIPKNAGFQRELEFNELQPDFFVSTGNSKVVFYTWLRDQKRISVHVPKTSKKFMNRVTRFTHSIWMKTKDIVLTGTATGLVVAWAPRIPLGLQKPPDPHLNIKEYWRSYKVGEIAVTAITAHNEYFVIGDESGHVKFFDDQFRIVRWTKSFKLAPVTSIAFNYGEFMADFKEEMQSRYDKNQRPHAHREQLSAVKDYTFGGDKFQQPSETTIERGPFFCPDFVIGCSGGSAYYYHMGEGKIDTLIHGTPGGIVALDTCPNTTHVTMSTADGYIQMYDYLTQTLIYSGKIFKQAVEVTYLKFHPSGSFAFFGMKTGAIYFRRAYSWKPMEAPLEFSSDAIERIIFSNDGLHMAHWDASKCVTLYFYQTKRSIWCLKGRHRSHFRPIVDLAFLHEEGKANRLFSLGEDRLLIEYDIPNSTILAGLKILSMFHAEQTSIPTAMVFDSPFAGFGPNIMFSNSEDKIKFYDVNERKLRRRCQGPCYGTPIHRMIRVQAGLDGKRQTKFILMLLGNKIGLMKTPVDGNPYRTMAVLGHPDGIREAVIGCTGKDIFTSGNKDNCCFMWEPNIQAIETCALSGGIGVSPFKQLLDAPLPAGQSLVEDVENVFYHLMLRRSVDSDNLFSMTLDIPLAEIPTVLRTCGYFPTETEIDQILDEVEFLGKLKTGERPTVISYNDFIKLFANHRPLPSLTQEEVTRAFEVLGLLNEEDELFIEAENFVEMLTEEGEVIPLEELPHYLPNMYHRKAEGDNLAAGKPAWHQLASIDEGASEENEHSHSSNESSEGTTDSSIEETYLKRRSRAVTAAEEEEDDQDDETEEGSRKKTFTVRTPGSRVGMDRGPSFLLPELEDLGEAAPFPFRDEMDGRVEHEEWELPEDIFLKFFSECILPEEALSPMKWENPAQDEERQLNKIYSESSWSGWDDILERWKGRDEWRYFKRVFERFKDKDYPISKKLKLAIEMDHYCKHGRWPGQDKRMTAFGEQIGEVELEELGEIDDLDADATDERQAAFRSKKLYRHAKSKHFIELAARRATMLKESGIGGVVTAGQSTEEEEQEEEEDEEEETEQTASQTEAVLAESILPEKSIQEIMKKRFDGEDEGESDGWGTDTREGEEETEGTSGQQDDTLEDNEEIPETFPEYPESEFPEILGGVLDADGDIMEEVPEAPLDISYIFDMDDDENELEGEGNAEDKEMEFPFP